MSVLGFSRSFAVSCAALVVSLAWPGCGSKSGLGLSGFDAGPPAAQICARSEFRSGYRDVALYVLLDRSESMAADDKWSEASAAIAAFVQDPSASGVAVGLQYFPRSGSCNEEQYALPAVPLALLPANGPAITASLATQKPAGETPTLLALRRAIEHARARMIAEPSRAVYIALVTDGTPNACGSSPSSVAATAGMGANGSPQVLTFAIGLEQGLVSELEQVAAQGGTGKPIVIGGTGSAAQQLLNALRGLQNTQADCRFPVPQTPGQSARASDLRVAFRTEQGALPNEVFSVGACTGSAHGYVVDDPAAPAYVELCPALCELLHQSPDSSVTLIAGCAGNFDGGAPSLPLDGGECSGVVEFSCVSHCGSDEIVWPICSGNDWACPPGHVNKQLCETCPIVPHACCNPDGTLDDASCIDGAWQCAPGSIFYGDPGCKPPEVCDEKLPCAIGQYCDAPNDLCGAEARAGSCKAPATTCHASSPPACGCDGEIYVDGCAAAASGVDVAVEGGCAAPPGRFACGGYFCSLATDVCKTTTRFEGPEPLVSYECVALPIGCLDGCDCDLCDPCPAGKSCDASCTELDGPELACSVL